MICGITNQVINEMLDNIWEEVLLYKGQTGIYDDGKAQVEDNGSGSKYIDIEFRSLCRYIQLMELVLIYYQIIRNGNISLIKYVIIQLPVIFFNEKSNNYDFERLYKN